MPKNDEGLSRTPPLPGDGYDVKRRQEITKRLRMLEGDWMQDVIDTMSQFFAPGRMVITGKPDTSTNLFLTFTDQLSVLYTIPPSVKNEDEDAAEPLITAVNAAGWWSMASLLQLYVLGLRECLVRPTIVDGDRLMYRIVTPNLVYAEALPDDPDMPAYIVEARVRPDPLNPKKDVWTWDVADIRDPDDPQFKILIPDDKGKHRDITVDLLGSEMSGDAYPFRYDDGTPFMPYTLYHAKRTGRLWNYRNTTELVEGALMVAVYWTFWGHVTRDESHPQRYGVDVQLRGAGQAVPSGNPSKAQMIAADMDPSLIMMFQSIGQGGGSLSQFNPGGDPEKLGQAIASFESRLAIHYNLGPDDFQRSGSAESGYAIALKRESVRAAQRKFKPEFQRADRLMLGKSAAMSNRAMGSTAYPESGYSLIYNGLPMTTQEMQDGLEQHERMIAMGLESKVDAYIEKFPGTSRDDAIEALVMIAKENKRLAALTDLAIMNGESR